MRPPVDLPTVGSTGPDAGQTKETPMRATPTLLLVLGLMACSGKDDTGTTDTGLGADTEIGRASCRERV